MHHLRLDNPRKGRGDSDLAGRQRWNAKRYGLTQAEAIAFVTYLEPTHEAALAVSGQISDWAFAHGVALSSPLARGYVLDMIKDAQRAGNPASAPYLTVKMPPDSVEGLIAMAAQMHASAYKYHHDGSVLTFGSRGQVVEFVSFLNAATHDADYASAAEPGEIERIRRAMQIVKDAAQAAHQTMPSPEYLQRAAAPERRTPREKSALEERKLLVHTGISKAENFARDLVEALGPEEARAFATEQMSRLGTQFWKDVHWALSETPRHRNPKGPGAAICVRQPGVCHESGCPAIMGGRCACDYQPPAERHGPLSYDEIRAGDRVTYADERGQTHSGRATPGHAGWMVEGATVSAESFVSAFRPR
jgi:hypothetical protein